MDYCLSEILYQYTNHENREADGNTNQGQKNRFASAQPVGSHPPKPGIDYRLCVNDVNCEG